MTEELISDLRRALDARHMVWERDQATIADLRAALAAVTEERDRLREALKDIAFTCQNLIDETDIIDPAWVVQMARAALERSAPETEATDG